MASSIGGRCAFWGAVMAATLMGAQDVSAQNFFDRLFGGARAPRYEPEVYREPARTAPRPPAPPKVTGPQYYTYKADALMRVDVAAMVASQAARDTRVVDGITTNSLERVAESASTEAADGTFVQALAQLGGVDVQAEPDIAKALVAHYSSKPHFIWLSDDAPSHRAEAALAVLKDAAAEGLDPADYAVPALPGSDAASDERLAARGRFEIATSARVLRYVRDAYRGRVDPNRISGYHDFDAKPLDLANVLDVLSDTFAVDTYLRSWHPKTSQYAALRSELAELRRGQENDIVVDPRLLLRPGGTSPEFAKLLTLIERNADDAMRAEFGAVLASRSGAETYSDDLVPLIKAAQEKAGVKGDGIIGPRSVAAIAGNSKAERIGKVVVAMEQSRWLPQQFASRHVFINVAAFDASYVENGEPRLSMRTVVGRNETQTYFFQDQIKYVEFHPYWGIPRSIVVNKYLPKLYSDPSYLDRIGYEVTDSKGRRVSSSSVSWTAYGANIPFDVRQPPGPKNSLGEMKIMFPNEHAIYMHDTPERHLFQRESRNYSNGCIRLEDPRAMAAAVLGWDRARVEERLKGQNGQAKLDGDVAVYVSYFTAWPDKAGQIAYYPDVYGRDDYMRKAMDRIAEVRAAGA